jgi:hypothetical protein
MAEAEAEVGAAEFNAGGAAAAAEVRVDMGSGVNGVDAADAAAGNGASSVHIGESKSEHGMVFQSDSRGKCSIASGCFRKCRTAKRRLGLDQIESGSHGGSGRGRSQKRRVARTILEWIEAR